MTLATSTARYRSFTFGIHGVQVEAQAGGAVHVRVPQDLDACPGRLTDKLLYWAEHAPQRSYMAKRGPDGAWRHISYAQALDFARRIGQGLLARGLSAERPLLI
jgi:feruloyl-CoA synthase